MRELIFDSLCSPFDFEAYKVALGEEIPMYQFHPLLGRYLYAKHKYPDLSTEEAIIKVDLENSEFKQIALAENTLAVPCGGCGGGQVR